ncbi:7764_t:CDS:2 [Acaulospora colombiana]|uniref:7764_t:CDS:1 n=1 Tax=Acaulospora colombiana TaxID=27376 RepID=A0ACA9RA75_9GLOM|nr:7764_t:CDS:2 [Acaulospora colombiana]
MWDANLAADVERKWKAEGKKHLFKVYPGTRHGFASRPNLSILKIKESWETVMQDIPSWFNETL